MQNNISVHIQQRNQMNVLPSSDMYISGKVLLSYLNELVALVGEKSVIMVLRRSGWMDQVRKIVSTRHDKTAPYAALVNINQQVEDIFGNTALRTLVYSASKRSFSSCFGGTEVARETLKWLEKNTESTLRLRVSLETISHLLQATSDQKIKIEESSSHYHLTIQQSVACWGVHGKSSPVCFYTVGMIRGGLHLLFGRDDYPVQELACTATGNKACEFIIRKFPFSDNEKGSGKTGFLTLPPHLR